MFNLLHLQQERAHKALTAKDLVDKAEKAESGPRPMSPEELVLFDKLTEEIKGLDAQIVAVQQHEQRRQASEDLIADLNKPTGRSTKPDEVNNTAVGGGASLSTARVPASARRSAPLKAFKPKAGETVADIELRAYRAGMWLRAAVFNDRKAQHFCLNNGLGADITNALSTTSNPDGGFLVPDELSRTIIDNREEYGVFRREARVWPMGSDTLLVPRRAGGVTVVPVGENSLVPETQPTFGQIQLVAKKAGGLCRLSSEIADDAVIDLADWVASEFAYAFAYYEDQCGFLGDGTSTYMGIRGLGNLFTTTGGAGGGQLVGAVDAASGHDTFAEIDAVDLTALMGRLPSYALPNAKWYTSSVGASVLFGRLAASAGGNNVQTLREGIGLNYLGYPIVISQVLPTSTGDLSDVPMLYFGDLSKAAQMGDRRMVRIFTSEHRYMDYDQIAIRGVERFDIVISEVGDTTSGSAGPIVALVGD